MVDAGRGDVYVPIDVSAEFLEDSATRLRAEYPTLGIEPVVGDIAEPLALDPSLPNPALIAFLGSTIGNFDPESARDLLSRIRATLRPTDRLLLGVDLIKDVAVLYAAYNDARGVTAEFNLNVLRVLNRELHANFNLGAFRHHAFYSVADARIEMHLVACGSQRVHIPLIGDVHFADGESVRTEISCKYDRASATAMLLSAGFRLTHWLTDADPLVALALAEPAA
jgi:L-histidine N-alpha-methyltransferase